MEDSKLTDRAQIVFLEAEKESENFKHGYVGTEHVLIGIIKENGYSSELLKKYGIYLDNVKRMIQKYIGFGDIKLEYISRTPRVKRLLEEGVIEAKKLNHKYVSPEHILLAIINQEEGMAYTILKILQLNFVGIRDDLVLFLSGKYDDKKIDREAERSKKEKTPMLDKYGRDLTELAREGMLDPVIGRENENQRLLEILCRRIKNNPCLIGEPGVGKTAVVEGLAQKIVRGDIPEVLREKRVVALDLTSMIAGAKYRGEFEERLKRTMEEIIKNKNIIVFIDEIHTIIGAGGAEGAIDASNILKPSLARGEIQCIGATTIEEYRKYIEKDSALERRFQPVNVKEPSKEETLEILFGLREKYEEHHNVRITDDALEAAVNLADRYINDRFMPDKAIDLIDEGSSKVRIQNLIAPPELKEIEKEIECITKEKEEAVVIQNFEKAADLRDKEKRVIEKLENMKQEWNSKNSSQVLVVTPEHIASVVSSWTKIPVEKLSENESERLLKLEEILHKRVIGQDEAVKSIARAVRRARVGIKDPNKPIGSFIFLGPTGVGKTELSKALAEVMFGDENNIIRIDMSEYMESHAVSRLIGSPPGYVGYEEGGQLTEAVRRNPYSIVLLDEIEKAHSDIFNILLQIMDDGRLTDSKGKVVDFKNTIIIMTSNIGSQYLLENNNEDAVQPEIKDKVMNELKLRFKPEFLNRVDDIIMFKPLSESGIKKIIDIFLKDVSRRLKEKNIEIEVTDAAKTIMANEGYDVVYGARPLKRYIQNTLENRLARMIIRGDLNYGSKVRIDGVGDEITITPVLMPVE